MECRQNYSEMEMVRRVLLALGVASLCCAEARADGVVNVYSYRQPQLVQPLFDAFTAKTGIQVRMVFAEKGLVERMEQEGDLSPVDVLLTSDVGRLVDAADKGLAQPVEDAAITGKVPAGLRDPGNQWFGLTMRARVVYASRERVKQEAISYEELADPKWKGKICVRPGDHPYNVGLISAMIAHKGVDAARSWLSGLKANLAMKPNGNDRSQAKSVYAGECDLAIANTYYMGLMQTDTQEPEQQQWAASARIIFPASPDMGTHVNISGMLMAKNAPDRANALSFMEFLASDEAQKLYADSNFEYPVNPAVAASAIVTAWGPFTPDTLNIRDIAAHQKEAARLVDEVQFNN
jgi:iron(III) transport system substrate-binding protein